MVRAMNMDIALIENLQPFMDLFIKEPNVNTAKRAALVHAQAAGIYNKLDAAGKKEFEQFCSYLWMMAAKPRAEYQKHQLQNPIALKKWFWDTRPDNKYDPKELAMGTAIEAKEHGVPAIIAKKIAKDHLDEIPNYYTLLNMVEHSVDPRRKNPSSATDTKYMKPFVEKPKKEKEPERTINYAEFNPPKLYKQNHNNQSKSNPNAGSVKPKLLIVEDNKIQAQMNEVLAEDDFECKIAYNGTEGIANLAWADAVCTDGDFPFNQEFYAALKASGKPFIINSGNLDFKNQGELEFVYKPASIKHALILLKQAAMQKKNPTNAAKKSLIVQSVVFPTPKFTNASAKEWLKKHGFKRPAADKKPNTIRFRQQEPKRFKGFFTHKYPNGVSVVVGTLTKNFQGKYKVFHRNKPMSFTDLTVRGAAKKKS